MGLIASPALTCDSFLRSGFLPGTPLIRTPLIHLFPFLRMESGSQTPGTLISFFSDLTPASSSSSPSEVLCPHTGPASRASLCGSQGTNLPCSPAGGIRLMTVNLQHPRYLFIWEWKLDLKSFYPRLVPKHLYLSSFSKMTWTFSFP